jgi:aryl-alcohol dehydrogenase-like predicted oxidoreductase
VISYYSLASGFLTGKYRSEADLAKSAARGGAAKKYLNARGKKVLDALDEVAGRHNSKPVAVALAWLMARPGITAPIASATTVEQLAEIARAAELNLSGEDISLLDQASAS